MELTAVLEALWHWGGRVPCITVHSDSQYVVHAFTQGWTINWIRNKWFNSNGKPVSNRDLWEQILGVMDEYEQVAFVWVRGHNGNTYNEEADRLATTAVRMLKESME